MKTIEEIISDERQPTDIIKDLKKKSIIIPPWAALLKEYDPKKHPVMTDKTYVDKVKKSTVEKVVRVKLGLQRLATKRMTELVFGIPVKRTYTAENEQEKKVSQIMEKIYEKNRIDSVNIERGNMLFAGCEFATIWYGVEQKNSHNLYKEPTNIKVRCRNYSPMKGDSLYPLFDDYDDMIALSVGYKRLEDDSEKEYFDVYTSEKHIRYKNERGTGWIEDDREDISIGKIAGIYSYRPTPIWEDTSDNVYEIEWTLSRNGNYIKKNSKPVYAIFTDKKVVTGEERDDDFRNVQHYPADGKAGYITWEQATESIKFQVEELRKSFFTELQLPDMSYENMKTTPMSGEARKMMFIDAQLKVGDEKGRIIEFLDRECNVIKAFMAIMYPALKKDIETIGVTHEVVAFNITDEKDTIANIMSATGGKPIMSQETGVKQLGWVDNVDEEVQKLKSQDTMNLFEPTE